MVSWHVYLSLVVAMPTTPFIFGRLKHRRPALRTDIAGDTAIDLIMILVCINIGDLDELTLDLPACQVPCHACKLILKRSYLRS